jgi:hypothetical protein
VRLDDDGKMLVMRDRCAQCRCLGAPQEGARCGLGKDIERDLAMGTLAEASEIAFLDT